MDTYLVHHGILGQKWGIRRFQNEDGTLTPAGQKRYATEGVSDKQAARGYTKRLNDYERALARNVALSTNALHNTVQLADRKKSLGDKLKNAKTDKERDRLNNKISKVNEQGLRQIESAVKYSKYMADGSSFIHNLISSIKSDSRGFNINTRFYIYDTASAVNKYNTQKGAAFAAYYRASRAFGMGTNPKAAAIIGLKHKVRPKDG